MRRCVFVILAGLLSLVACSSTPPAPEVLPLEGPAPGLVLCAPAVDHMRAPGVAVTLDALLFPLVSSRGYSSVPVELSQRLLETVGWTFQDPALGVPRLSRLRETYGIDAVLLTDLVRWIHAGGKPDRYEFELRWSLVDTADGAVIWSFTERGVTGFQTELRIRGPVASDEPGVGAQGEQFVYDVGRGEAEDVVARLQRGAILRLPRRMRR